VEGGSETGDEVIKEYRKEEKKKAGAGLVREEWMSPSPNTSTSILVWGGEADCGDT